MHECVEVTNEITPHMTVTGCPCTRHEGVCSSPAAKSVWMGRLSLLAHWTLAQTLIHISAQLAAM